MIDLHLGALGGRGMFLFYRMLFSDIVSELLDF